MAYALGIAGGLEMAGGGAAVILGTAGSDSTLVVAAGFAGGTLMVVGGLVVATGCLVMLCLPQLRGPVGVLVPSRIPNERRRLLAVVMALTSFVMLAPSIVVGLLTRSLGWGLLAFFLIWIVGLVVIAILLAAVKGTTTVHKVFKPMFQSRVMSRLFPKLPPRE
jgi:MFS family permease